MSTTSVKEPCVPEEKGAAAAPWGQLRAAGQKGLALVDQAVVSGTNFVTGLVVGRVAGADELGVYSLGFTLVLLALTCQDALVSSPYTIYGNRALGQERSRRAGAALIQLALLGLFLSLALALAAWLVRDSWPSVTPVIGVLALAVPWVLLREFRRRLSYAHHHVRESLVLDSSVAILQLGGLLTLAATGVLSAATAHATTGVACAVCAVTALVLVRRRFAFRSEQLSTEMRRHWSFGRWLLASQLTALGYWYLVHWLVAARLGTGATGAFAACMAVVTVANPFILGFGAFVGPSVARAFVEGGPVRVRQILLRATVPLAIVTLLLSGVAAVAGGQLITWLYGADYAGHGATVALLGLLVPLVATSTMADHGLRAVERPVANFQGSLLSLIVTIAATWILLERYQLVGAALGLLAGEVAGFIVRWSSFWYYTRAGQERTS